MNRFFCGSLFLVVFCNLSSCSLQRLIKGKKNRTTVSDTSLTTTVNEPIRRAILPAPDTLDLPKENNGTAAKLLDVVTPIWNARLNYRTLSGKSKVHFEGPGESQEFTTSIKVIKDSAIWVDITALGGIIHAARVLITTDSFFMLNYLQKEYSSTALTYVAKILPVKVDFNSLQNLLTGEPLSKGTIMSVTDDVASWLLNITDETYRQKVTINKSDNNITADQVNTVAANGPQVNIKFDRFENKNGKKISMNRTVNIQNLQDHYLLEMEFTSLEFDKELDMPFTIPGRFNKK